MAFFASGGNYTAEVIRGIAICRVFMRPDLSREQGAQLAQELAGVFRRLVRLPAAQVKAVQFDMRRATNKWGPITQAAIDQMLACCEDAERRVAVLCSGDPIQIMLLRQTIKRVARQHGALFTEEDEADAWCHAAEIG